MKQQPKTAYTLARKLFPGKVLTALAALGFDKRQTLSSFATYHTETGFFDHAENWLMHENSVGLTREELYAIWGYTTRFFYLELNSLLRSEGLSEHTLPISRLLISGLQKLPKYSGPVWREIQLSGTLLADYLAAHKPGFSVSCRHFVSCGSNYSAASRNKTGKNIVEYYSEIQAYDISAIADGIRYRGYSPLELLAFPPKRFLVEEVFVEAGGNYYISMREIAML